MRSRKHAAVKSLTLPGSEMLCYYEGVRTHVFTKNTSHIFVERDPLIKEQINRRTARFLLKSKPVVWGDEITKLSLYDSNVGALDFVYLDLCAALTPATAAWIFDQLGPHLDHGATLAVTLSRNWRRSNYMRWLTESRDSSLEMHGVWQACALSIDSAKCAGSVTEDVSEFFADDEEYSCEHNVYTHVRRHKYPFSQLVAPYYHAASIDALTGIALLLPFHEFQLDACLEYRRNPEDPRGHRMTTLVLNNIWKQRQIAYPVSLLDELLDQLPRKRQRMTSCDT